MRRNAALAVLSVALTAAVVTLSTDVGAAASGCSTRAGLAAPAAVQERAVLCLTNRARRDRGLSPLADEGSLSRAARHKSADILRCGEFSHEACGREFTYWIERLGYRGCASAENIAWGTGSRGGVRAIFRAWMRSPGHRQNILGDYEQIGIGLRIGRLEGHVGAQVWTQDFGARC